MPTFRDKGASLFSLPNARLCCSPPGHKHCLTYCIVLFSLEHFLFSTTLLLSTDRSFFHLAHVETRPRPSCASLLWEISSTVDTLHSGMMEGRIAHDEQGTKSVSRSWIQATKGHWSHLTGHIYISDFHTKITPHRYVLNGANSMFADACKIFPPG